MGVIEAKEYYSSKEMVNVPIVGKITAGQPILAVENITDTFQYQLILLETVTALC